MKFKDLRKGMAITFIDGDKLTIVDAEIKKHPGALDESCHITMLSHDNKKHYMFGAPNDDIYLNWKAE
jgi:translation elongation factor P/translation initiation factor 5A